MGKKIGLIVGIIAIIVIVVVGIVFAINANQVKENDLSALNSEELISLVNQVYEQSGLEFPMLETTELPLTDIEMLTYHVGLTSVEGVKSVIASMPMMNAQPYTLALIQTERSADIEKIKQDVLQNCDLRKWVCVNADKASVTNSDTVVLFIMGSNDEIIALENAFAEITGNTLGKKSEKLFSESGN